MASFIAKIVGKKILGETVKNKFGKEDPFFETVPATRLDGKPSKSGRTVRRKKALPPGISEHDGQVLTKVKRRAYRLDLSLFTFMGIRFGWGSVIGLIPAIGDALDAMLALMVLKTCCQIDGGLPNGIKLKMLINIIFDFFLGIVPLLGDLADAMYKANTKNALLLEDFLREKGKQRLKEQGLPVPKYDPSDPDYFDRRERGELPPSRGPSREPSRDRSREPVQQVPVPATSTPSPQDTGKSTEGGRGWFGRSKTRPRDVEMGADSSAANGSRRSQRQQQRNVRH